MIIILIIIIFINGRYLELIEFLHFAQESVAIAGGIILMIIGLRMIFSHTHDIQGEQEGEEPLIVPIAIPMIAGPYVLAMWILMIKNEPEDRSY